ncbi:MAG: prephenate dehydrogenase/arogenate dehydrogenase family protein [Chromatiales bacterium]|jgi:prephenate dehydrogenase|nr:prephenate dehydrogenase/arogenate dehydrogenase family protein [Chromatiales bacterium]MDX9765708.1 prephenate dehydrogenase/arogenate dehydrogenase family protein [Ectothiorhodospiraceae bacterium]
MIRRLAIIGVGLIGGSLALALRRAGYCGEVIGCGRGVANLDEAVRLGIIDRYETDPAQAVQGADFVVLAVPLGAMQDTFAVIRDVLAADAVVTDVGSAKGSVVAAARAACGEVPPWFVPGHPIAGTERSGATAAFAELFQGRRVILTPTATTADDARRRVRAAWEVAGAVVEEMPVEHHDEVLAATSHLPHMLAFTLVESLSRMSDSDEIFRYAAGGFRDFTRIASSDPVMWRDIALANRDALLTVTQRYRRDLDELMDAIARGDGQALLRLFQDAKAARDRFCH